MTSVFIVFQVLLVVFITIAVLLQKSSSIGLGAYSGSNESLFGAKGPAGFLAKFTFILGFLLVANTIALSYFYNIAGKDSVAEKIAAPSVPALDANATTAVGAPAAPQAPQSVPNAGENLAPQAPQSVNSSENSAPQTPNEQNSTQK